MTRWRQVRAVLVVAAVAALVLAIGGVLADWYLPVYLLVLVLALATLWTPGTRFGFPEAAVVALLALPCLQLLLGRTANRAVTEVALLQWMAAAAVFVIAANTLNLDYIARGLGAACGVLGLEAMAQLFLTPQRILGLIPVTTATPMGTFVNVDDFAACMGLLIPFALFLAVRRPSRHAGDRGWSGLWWALSAVVGIGAVLISASRGGALVVLLELIAFAVWQYRRRGRRSAVVLAAMVVLLAGGAFAAGYHRLAARFEGNLVSGNERISFAQSGLRMGEAKPALGWGLGTWRDVYPRYAVTVLNGTLVYAHNDWVQLFAETGAAGLALVVLLGLALLLKARTACRHAPVLAPAAVIALAGMCLHSTVEFVFHIPALLLLFALIAGTLVAAAASRRAAPPGPHLRSHRHHARVYA